MEKKDLRRCNTKKAQPGSGKGMAFCAHYLLWEMNCEGEGDHFKSFNVGILTSI